MLINEIEGHTLVAIDTENVDSLDFGNQLDKRRTVDFLHF